MSELAWRLRRLRKMSPGEVVERLRDSAIKQMWRVGPLRPKAPRAPRQPIDARRFALSEPDALIPGVEIAAREAVLEEARRILAGAVTILGHESTLLGERPDWFTDIRTGRRAPTDVYCFDVPYRDATVVGEIKYVWEPSRHHHLTVLAAAYYLTGEEAFAERVAAHLDSWWAENAFLQGVHWLGGIELGIRLISWVWLRRLLHRWPRARSLFEENPVFVGQLYHHQLYLSALPSHGSSANNHLIAEQAGLFAAASAFPIFFESGRWRAGAAHGLAAELKRQTFRDGLNRELATGYHGLVLELFLAAAAEDDPARPALDPAIWQGIAAMADALASLVDARGRPPRQGDEDGAHALMVDGAGFDRWDSLLATCDSLLGRGSWWPSIDGGDVRTALLAARAGRRAVAGRAQRRIDHFKDGGMVLLRDLERDGNELWCRCDHGALGFLSTAAHGHADALALELRHGGVDILCDPGTYCYHGREEWRDYFRSTAAHNTLELDGIAQARAGGPFLWLDQPSAALESVSGLDRGDIAEWIAHHRGYQGLAPPAIHRRRVRLDRRARMVEIFDEVEGGGEHLARLSFHIGPLVSCRLDGASARLAWSSGGRSLRATLSLPPALKWTVHWGETSPVLGWYSSEFGLLEPTAVLVGRGIVGSRILHSRLTIAEEPVVLPEGAAAAASALEHGK